MTPRRSAADAAFTHEVLLVRAASMASTDGLEGMSLGRLADAAGMSKSGVVRHFESKERLQLATLAHALDRFRALVWDPAAGLPAGRERLDAVLENWMAYLTGDTFPGGCFLTAAAAEFDGRAGPVRDAVARGLRRWLRALAGEVATMVAAGELPGTVDPMLVAQHLNSLAVGANQLRQLLGDDAAPARARVLMAEVLASG